MKWSGELCWRYIISKIMFLLFTKYVSIQRAWNASLEIPSKIVQLSDSWIKRPPDAKVVGSKSKTWYPGMQEQDPFSFEFVILVSVTIMLNWKSISSSNFHPVMLNFPNFG